MSSADFSVDFSRPLPYSPTGWFDDRAFRFRDRSYGFSLLLFSFAHPTIWSRSLDSFTLTRKANQRVDRPT